ncbi:MAG: archaeal proteasome endopeptidase complex subunit alpha [archaeon]
MYPISRAQTGAYDRVATMFSPDGRLYQVEYASKIVEQGTLGAALIYNKGVLFGADKKVSSPLILSESIEKLFVVDDHIGAISSGLVGDARRLVQIARQEAQGNQMYYEEPIEVEALVKKVSGIMQLFTQYGGMRPFGVSLIIGGIDNSSEKKLFEAEPSGALAEYKAVAIGKGKKEAMKFLEKNYREGISFDEGVKLLTGAIETSLEEKEKIDVNRVDFAFIEDGKKIKVMNKNELKAVLSKK